LATCRYYQPSLACSKGKEGEGNKPNSAAPALGEVYLHSPRASVAGRLQLICLGAMYQDTLHIPKMFVTSRGISNHLPPWPPTHPSSWSLT